MIWEKLYSRYQACWQLIHKLQDYSRCNEDKAAAIKNIRGGEETLIPIAAKFI